MEKFALTSLSGLIDELLFHLEKKHFNVSSAYTAQLITYKQLSNDNHLLTKKP